MSRRTRSPSASPSPAPARPAPSGSNAVRALVASLPAPLLRERLVRERLRRAERLALRFELDLAAFLNGALTDELRALCAACALPSRGTPGLLRQRLWAWGAALERRALGAGIEPGSDVQPPAIVVRGILHVAASSARARASSHSRSRRGAGPDAGGGVSTSARAARFPAADAWPRPVPVAPACSPAPPPSEPASLDELLARADALVGVRLGARGRDKGQHGARISALLGIPRSSDATPDWRGEVEVKSLAVVRAAGATWRLKDGPAIAMRSIDAGAKLHRVLWMIRIDEGEVPGAPVLSWFYQELDDELAAGIERARHLRPKGGKGTNKKGWYLRRDFFEFCGLLKSLNG